jgi:hypothetical protein
MRAGDFLRINVQILDDTLTAVPLHVDYFVEFVEYFDETVESMPKRRARTPVVVWQSCSQR